MKKKGNLWSNKRKTFIFCIVIVMLVVVSISFVSFFKSDVIDEENEKTPYNSMYNASRYFFRVFYPDDWDVNADSYGFLLNPEGLVLEAYPLKKIPVTPAPTAADGSTPVVTASPTLSSQPTTSATIDPREGMERNKDLTMSFYYKEYDALYEYIKTLVPSAPPSAEVSPTPTATPEIPSPSGNTEVISSASPEKKNRRWNWKSLLITFLSSFKKNTKPQDTDIPVKRAIRQTPSNLSYCHIVISRMILK